MSSNDDRMRIELARQKQKHQEQASSLLWSMGNVLFQAANVTRPDCSEPFDEDDSKTVRLALEDGPRVVPGQSSRSSFNSTRKQQRQRHQSRSRSRHSGAVRPELPKPPLRDTCPPPKSDQDKGARKISPKSQSNQKTPTPTKRPEAKQIDDEYSYDTYQTTSSSEEPHRQSDWSHRQSVCSWHDRGNLKQAVHTSDMTKANTEALLGVSPSD